MPLRSTKDHERKTMTHQETIRNFDSEIERNVSEAKEHMLSDLEALFRSILMKFQIKEESRNKVVRFRPETPYYFRTAASWIARLAQDIRDFEDSGEEGFNKAARLLVKARLVEAQVKCAMARALVEYWRSDSEFKRFSSLAHQVEAYADQCTGENWDYFAPLVLVNEEEPLAEASAKYLRLLMSYACTALAYAQALDAQMQVLPHWRRVSANSFAPVEEEMKDEEAVVPAEFPPVKAWGDPAFFSQEEIARQHMISVGEDFREDAWLGIRQQPVIKPFYRLAGFQLKRARRRKSRRPA